VIFLEDVILEIKKTSYLDFHYDFHLHKWTFCIEFSLAVDLLSSNQYTMIVST